MWPKIPGLHSFKGELIHSANWDESFSPVGKRVAVLGYGATAVQLVPAILPQVKYMDHYVRGQAWITMSEARHGSPRQATLPPIRESPAPTSTTVRILNCREYYQWLTFIPQLPILCRNKKRLPVTQRRN